jgi:hypothetical protein
VVGGLAGCSWAGGVDSRTAMRTTEAVPAPSSASPGATAPPAGLPAPAAGVACDVHTCTLTLRTPDAPEVKAFDTTLSLDGVRDGVAALTVGEAKVDCRAGEGTKAGRLTLFCAAVSGDSVTLTAEVG